MLALLVGQGMQTLREKLSKNASNADEGMQKSTNYSAVLSGGMPCCGRLHRSLPECTRRLRAASTDAAVWPSPSLVLPAWHSKHARSYKGARAQDMWKLGVQVHPQGCGAVLPDRLRLEGHGRRYAYCGRL